MSSLREYRVSYLDSKDGSLQTIDVLATNEEAALEEAQEDYYYGKLVEITGGYKI